MAAATQAVGYIDSIQNTDGGFPGFGPSSAAGSTLDAIFALSATGVDPKTVENGTNGPDDYLSGQAAAFSASSPGAAAKLVLGVLTMDLDETSFGSTSPFAAMQGNYNIGTGQYGSDTFAQALYLLSLNSGGYTIPPAASAYLTSLQLGNGSWEYCCGFGGDTNTTAFAVRALLASGIAPSASVITNAFAFLAANQEADGGFPYLLSFGSEPNSTGFVLQALVAAGENIDTGGPWDKGANLTPLVWLVGSQNLTTGALRYFGADDAFATYQGVPGLMLAAYPERSHPDEYTATSTPTATSSPSSTPSVTATATLTATLTPTATRTPTGTATKAAANSPATGPTQAPTAVNSVLAATAQPGRVGTVAGLPQTGYGGESHAIPPVLATLWLSGMFLIAAGFVVLSRRPAG